jgi:hypothetical protein
VYYGIRSPTFRRNVLPLFSESRNNASNEPEKGELTLKIERVHSSEKWEDIYKTTLCYISEDRLPTKR